LEVPLVLLAKMVLMVLWVGMAEMVFVAVPRVVPRVEMVVILVVILVELRVGMALMMPEIALPVETVFVLLAVLKVVLREGMVLMTKLVLPVETVLVMVRRGEMVFVVVLVVVVLQVGMVFVTLGMALPVETVLVLMALLVVLQVEMVFVTPEMVLVLAAVLMVAIRVEMEFVVVPVVALRVGVVFVTPEIVLPAKAWWSGRRSKRLYNFCKHCPQGRRTSLPLFLGRPKIHKTATSSTTVCSPLTSHLMFILIHEAALYPVILQVSTTFSTCPSNHSNRTAAERRHGFTLERPHGLHRECSSQLFLMDDAVSVRGDAVEAAGSNLYDDSELPSANLFI
jgi:hypothetical protein